MLNLCVLYSGGKDSNLALLKTLSYGYKVSCLLSFKPESEESEIFHFPNIEIVKLQAKALRLPVIMEKCPDNEKSSINSLKSGLKKAIDRYNIDGLVTGAIRSTYQATRFQKACDELSLWCFNPLWLRDEISILKEIIENNFNVIFVRVAGMSLDFLGKKIDNKLFKELVSMKYINLAGEGGEYETLVLDMPLFKDKITIKEQEIRITNELDATLVVKNANLIPKDT